MIRVDPASAEFERLPRYKQARVYLAWGWTLDAIADEMGIRRNTASTYVNEAAYAKKREARRLWKHTPHGRETANRGRRAWREKRKAEGLPA